MPTSYFNPSTTRPDLGGMPGLQGMQAAQDMNTYNQMMFLQRMMQQEALGRTQAENVEYGLEAPKRAAERAAAIPKFGLQQMVSEEALRTPGYAPAQVAGDIGEAESKRAKGKLDIATTPSKIEATNQKNLGDALESAARHIELTASINPVMAEGEYQQLRTRMPPQIRDRFPPNFTSEVPALIRQFGEAAVQSPEQRRRMEIEKEETKRAKEVAEINAQARKDAAARAGAKVRSAKEQLYRGTPGQRLAAAQIIELSEEASEQDKIQAAVVAHQSALEVAGSMGVRLPPQLPGLPPPSATELIRQLQGLATQRQGAPGAPGAAPKPAERWERGPDGKLRKVQ